MVSRTEADIKGISSAVAVAMPFLPGEIVEKILINVDEVKDLLKCRLVSRLWHQHASSVCRRGNLNLTLNLIKRNGRFFLPPRPEKANQKIKKFPLKKLCDDFQDFPNLPWSACKLGLWLPGHFLRRGMTKTQLTRFSGVFGPHVKSFTVLGDDFEGLVLLLRGMPNLSSLTMDSVNLHMKPLPPSSPITLKLKKLSIVGDWDLCDILHLEAIMTYFEFPPEVLYLEITPHEQHATKERKWCQLIAPVPNIILKLGITSSNSGMKIFRTLTGNKLRIVGLELGISSPEKEFEDNAVCFEVFEKFLADISTHLKFLKLSDDSDRINLWTERGTAILTIPDLPHLQSLEIDGQKFKQRGEPTGQFLSFIAPFRTNQFPMLGEVKLTDCAGHVKLFGLTSFDGVRKLDVIQNGGNTGQEEGVAKYWNRIFSNLDNKFKFGGAVQLKTTQPEINLTVFPKIVQK